MHSKLSLSDSVLFCHFTPSGGGHENTSGSNVVLDPKQTVEIVGMVAFGTSAKLFSITITILSSEWRLKDKLFILFISFYCLGEGDKGWFIVFITKFMLIKGLKSFNAYLLQFYSKYAILMILKYDMSMQCNKICMICWEK